jgi:phosphoribosyl-ATP pyrophosphohydrolase
MDARPAMLAELARVIEQRRGADPGTSYVAGMLAGDREAPQRKVGEEAVEVLLAPAGSPELVAEVADLWFHSMLLLARDGIDPLAPLEVLRTRRNG